MKAVRAATPGAGTCKFVVIGIMVSNADQSNRGMALDQGDQVDVGLRFWHAGCSENEQQTQE
jgi:hypothetical protein